MKAPAFMRALRILADHPLGLDCDEFYRLMWPEQWKADTSVGGKSLKGGNANGGPSRTQCATNWLLGRINRKWPNSVYRECPLSKNRIDAGKWFIMQAGREALK